MLTAAVTSVRRVLTTTLLTALIPVAAAALVCAAVLTCPLALRGHRRWRLVRITSFALLYLVVDLAGVAVAAAVWLRRPSSSPGHRAHSRTAAYAELERLLGVVRRSAARIFGLTVEVTPVIPDAGDGDGAGDEDGTGRRDATGRRDGGGEPRGAGPLLVFVRHAGPGDSFLLVHSLLAEAGLRPHIVLKRMLRLDPCLDVLLGRLPHCFVPASRGTTVPQCLAVLAEGLGPGDALVLFPEGGNFTDRRHRRAIASLRRHGRRRTAARAERMTHVLPPRTAGALAVLAAAPTADVVFVAHTGLDAIDSLRSGWSAIPLRTVVRAHWWRVPATEVPPGDEARAEWLLGQWARIDAWIGRHAQET